MRLSSLVAATTRAARLRLRLAGVVPPHFDALGQVPLSQLHPQADMHMVALAAGLLHYRRQLDAELSGARLQPIAALCGEALLDRICATIPPPPEQCATSSTIPDAESLLLLGHELIERRDDPAARALASSAFLLVERT
ncbi:hypothetical protein ACMGDM_19040 [Sphingomonas sp. DT-51]|uniref:hypothetical protein n=1 Tax=Sphingomonas sp. DT-51 TaxID=3396165 RepID=UPI003F195734